MKDRKRKKDKCLSLLTTPHKKYKKATSIQENPFIEDWFTQNCNQEFISKHLCMDTSSAIKLATTMRRGNVMKSTVIILDSYSTKNAFKSIQLKPKEFYTLNVDNMVYSTTLNWKRGSGSVLLKTNENSQIYHLENSTIINLKASNKVAQCIRIKF